MTDYKQDTALPTGGGKKRLDYLDAARALAMICVVYHHVMIFTLNLTFPIYSGDLVSVFMVPLFFFISGYVAYKPVETWNIGFTSRKLLNKIRQLLIPAILFFLLFIHTVGSAWRFPGGYWFMVSLFEMFLIFYIISCLSHKLWPRYYTSAIIIFTFIVITLTFSANGTQISKYLLLHNLRAFLPYFAIGVLAGKFKQLVTKRIHHNLVTTTCILILTIGSILVWKVNIVEINHYAYSLIYSLMRIASVILLFGCFIRNGQYWASTSIIPSTFRLIGKHTLDIYMIHYFFLWPTVQPLTEFLTAYTNEMLIIPICLIFTAISIALSLLVSHILRSSKFIATWVFAA